MTTDKIGESEIPSHSLGLLIEELYRIYDTIYILIFFFFFFKGIKLNSQYLSDSNHGVFFL